MDKYLTIKEILSLQDGTRVVLTQTGNEWGEDSGVSGVCVKVGLRLIEADIERPSDKSVFYPYYLIPELEVNGYECSVKLEE